MGIKILIVDDDPLNQKLLKMRLEYAGYAVSVAGNGQEALESFKSGIPDFIVCDDVMPVMDGFAFCKRLKENKATAQIPIIVLFSNPHLKDSFLVLGVNDCLEYPLNGNVLVERIQKILLNQNLEKNFQADKVVRILLCEQNTDLLTFIQEALKAEDRRIDTAADVQAFAKKALTLVPQVIVINIQMKDPSAKQISDQLNRMHDLKTQVLFYSHFSKRHMADDSDLHYFYTHCLGDIAHSVHFPVYYLGILDKETFKDAVESRMKQMPGKS